MTISQSATERIAATIAGVIGPNWVDYPAVSIMTTEYVHRFGTVEMDDIPEDKWTTFLSDCEAGRFWA
jgi:hypothetical protein